MTSPMTSSIGPELGQLLALRRVHRGHVVLLGEDLFIDHCRPVPSYLQTHLRDLLGTGRLRLGPERAEYGQRPVLATASGSRLHTALESAVRATRAGSTAE